MSQVLTACLLALATTLTHAIAHAAPKESAVPAESGAARAWEVVIDPGHGGRDRGAEGGGLVEKELTLDIAQRVAEILTAGGAGVRVRLTREEDRWVPVDERVALASDPALHAFLSIHANASEDTSASGVEVFFLSLAEPTDSAAQAVADFENAAHRAPGDSAAASGTEEAEAASDLLGIVADVQRGEAIARSARLAESVVNAVREESRVARRGVKQADFRVLRPAVAPAILIEVGFVTSALDAEMLASEAYRDWLAERIALGVQNFLSREAGGPAFAYYVVRRGETLTAIAHRHGTTAEELAAMNGIRVGRLEPGQRLRVPL
jgi:N-acetylmuramoyl-L-alanine amidase